MVAERPGGGGFSSAGGRAGPAARGSWGPGLWNRSRCGSRRAPRRFPHRNRPAHGRPLVRTGSGPRGPFCAPAGAGLPCGAAGACLCARAGAGFCSRPARLPALPAARCGAASPQAKARKDILHRPVAGRVRRWLLFQVFQDLVHRAGKFVVRHGFVFLQLQGSGAALAGDLVQDDARRHRHVKAVHSVPRPAMERLTAPSHSLFTRGLTPRPSLPITSAMGPVRLLVSGARPPSRRNTRTRPAP